MERGDDDRVKLVGYRFFGGTGPRGTSGPKYRGI